MSGNRRSSSPDTRQAAHDRLEERLAGQVRDSVDALAERSEASFKVVIDAVGSLQSDIRRGQIDRAAILGRLGEFEIALGENRDATNALRTRVEEIERDTVASTRHAVEVAAPVAAAAAASATRGAPKELWTSLSGFQKVMAIAAACVAILAGLSGAMTGLERLVRGGVEGARVAWTHTKGDDASTRKAAD